MLDKQEQPTLKGTAQCVATIKCLIGLGALAVLVMLVAVIVVSSQEKTRQARTVSQLRSHGLGVYDNEKAARDAFTYGGDGLGTAPCRPVIGVLAPMTPNDVCEHIIDAHLDGLEDLRSLQVLNLSYCMITDITMKRIRSLRYLTHLSLSGTGITNAGLVELQGLTTLTHLELAFTSTSDAGLVSISQLPSLQLLDLTGTEITDTGLAQLCDLKSLRMLQLDLCDVTADGIAQLKCLDTLEALNLNRVPLRSADVDRLGQLKSLRFLSVLDSGLIDERLEKRLRELIPNLETVDMDSPGYGGGMFDSETTLPENQEIGEELGGGRF